MNATTPPAAPPARRRRWPYVVGAIVLALVVLALVWDWNWFKGPVERRVEAATGREFRIEGDLDVDLSLTAPTIRADGLMLANAEWSDEPEMVRVGRLEARIALWRLLRGQVVLPRLDLTEPRVIIETHEDGGNWVFREDAEDDGRAPHLPDLSNLRIVDGELVFREGDRRTDLRLSVDTVEPREAGTPAPLAVAGEGTYRDEPFTLEGRIESPLELIEAQSADTYRVDLRARAGATRAHVRGALQGQLRLDAFEADASLEGANLGDLYRLIGLALPETPPYTLEGRLARDGDTWSYRGFRGTVGDSDLRGDVVVETGGDRLRMEAELASDLLDFDDLAGFVGAPPRTGEGETASEQQQRQAAERAASGRILPDTPYDLGKLRSLDADVRLRAARIEAPGWPLEDMDAHMVLENGVVNLDPLNFGVAGGNVRSTIDMDASREPIRTAARINVRGLELPRLFPAAESMRDAVGSISGDAELRGTGNSVAAMLGSSSGDVALGMGSGRMSNLLLELVGLDIAEALRYWLGRDPDVVIRCGYVDFGVEDGLMTSRGLLFDTDDTVIYGDARINLADESLEIRVEPQPKDRSFLSVRTPLWIRGTLASPSVRPEASGLALRGAAAVALGSIAPPAALLALLELGPGEDSDCGASLRQQGAD
ncbi:AsmA family protein [Coralloluteibacterium thermophilus]|uniref:AsmA family protein n=1 Tax=Coralloluteibacterium thermophilum TaxID=2707049 RepID=A0ABV9NMY8_9GAMM